MEPLHGRHAADLMDAADPGIFTHTAGHPDEWSVAGFEREIASVLALPNVVAFALINEATGKAIGRSTYMDIRAEHRGLEVGRTWIGRAHHGTVVNPEMKLLMLRHAFETLSPTAIRVQLFTSGTNIHSQTAIAKLGAVREGTLRNHRVAFPDGPSAPSQIRDTVCFSIIAEEWPKVKRGLEERVAKFG